MVTLNVNVICRPDKVNLLYSPYAGLIWPVIILILNDKRHSREEINDFCNMSRQFGNCTMFFVLFFVCVFVCT